MLAKLYFIQSGQPVQLEISWAQLSSRLFSCSVRISNYGMFLEYEFCHLYSFQFFLPRPVLQGRRAVVNKEQLRSGSRSRSRCRPVIFVVLLLVRISTCVQRLDYSINITVLSKVCAPQVCVGMPMQCTVVYTEVQSIIN